MNSEDLNHQETDYQNKIDQLNLELSRKAKELQIVQTVSSEINATLDLEIILNKMLSALDKTFEFKHSMVLLPDDTNEKLIVKASHGYEESGIGAEVKFGVGIIGVVAKHKKIMRMGGIALQRQYLITVKRELTAQGTETAHAVQLPGLTKLQSQVAIPMLADDKLVGVLMVESTKLSLFDSRDEILISILANQGASAIEKAKAHASLKHINENLEELVRLRTLEITEQKEVIEEKNKSIMDSIHYAQRIQTALLPSKSFIEQNMPEHFILFKPKDIVSGDFYWANYKDELLYFAAIDCTGHGVPGSLVSIVAHSNLQRALLMFGLRKPSEILDKVNESVEAMFSTGHETDINDGMDISLMCFNKSKMQIEFSGANNALYLCRNGELMEYKGNKQPIGHYINRTNFSNQIIEVEKNDCIYFFTDGFPDQFGGPKGKKFKFKQLEELLQNNYNKPMQEQKELYTQIFEDWKGDIEQTDDVSLYGIRI